MVVDVGFSGANRSAGPIPQRPKPYTVNLSGEAMKQHERMMECRRRLEKTSADLNSAVQSLASANLEIDRLTAEVSGLRKELEAEKAKVARLTAQASQPKVSRKSKKTAVSSDSQ